MVKKLFSIAFLTAFYSHAVAVEVPTQFRGLWYPNTVDGGIKCANFKKNPDMESTIATSLYISRHKIYQFSDYGEGDVLKPFYVKQLTGYSWFFRSSVARDGGATDVIDDSFLKVDVNKRKLYWSSRYYSENAQDKKNFPNLLQLNHQSFIKCLKKINLKGY